jgi:four helix bundle protein
MPIRRFEDIEGWQSARELTRQVYAVAHCGEFSRDFGLRDQITRAAGSTMHNIAEGFDGGSNPEFIKFLRYSQRSCSEIQSQLYVALDQGYLSQEEFDAIYAQAERTHVKVGGFIRYLLSAPSPTPSNQEPRTPDHKLLPLYHERRTKNFFKLRIFI